MYTPDIRNAEALLQNVAEDWKAFWFNHGVVAKSLRELSAALDDMNSVEFAHHVNAERNDFANWVSDVIGDEALAVKLRLLSTLEATRRMVARRVAELEASLPVEPTVEAVAAAHDVAMAAAATGEAPVAEDEPAKVLEVAAVTEAAVVTAPAKAKTVRAKRSPSARKSSTTASAKKPAARKTAKNETAAPRASSVRIVEPPAPPQEKTKKKASLFSRLLKL